MEFMNHYYTKKNIYIVIILCILYVNSFVWHVKCKHVFQVRVVSLLYAWLVKEFFSFLQRTLSGCSKINSMRNIRKCLINSKKDGRMDLIRKQHKQKNLFPK
jgi:hypothetical protein